MENNNFKLMGETIKKLYGINLQHYKKIPNKSIKSLSDMKKNYLICSPGNVTTKTIEHSRVWRVTKEVTDSVNNYEIYHYHDNIFEMARGLSDLSVLQNEDCVIIFKLYRNINDRINFKFMND